MTHHPVRWQGEPHKDPFGARPRPSRLRRAFGRLFRRRDDDAPRGVHLAGYLAGSAAGLGLAVLTHADHWLMITLGATAGDVAAWTSWRRSRKRRAAADEPQA